MTLLGDVFCVCPVVPYHALGGDFAGSAADGLSSAPPPAAEPASPVAAEAAGAGAPPACEQKAAFCLCYFGLLQHFSLSRGTGVCRASVSALPLSSAAEAELPPGFDPTLCNFDGQRPVCVGGKRHQQVSVCVFGKHTSFQKHLSTQTALPLERKPSLVAGAIAKINPKSAAFSSKAVCVCILQIRQRALAGSCLCLPLPLGMCGAPVSSNDIPSEL